MLSLANYRFVNLTKMIFTKKLLTFIGVIIFELFVLSSCSDSCKGHENDIKNIQINKAERMGLKTNSITIEYIGNCEYKCTSDVYDRGSAYSNPNRINSIVIFKWKDNSYSFVRKE